MKFGDNCSFKPVFPNLKLEADFSFLGQIAEADPYLVSKQEALVSWVVQGLLSHQFRAQGYTISSGLAAEGAFYKPS